MSVKWAVVPALGLAAAIGLTGAANGGTTLTWGDSGSSTATDWGHGWGTAPDQQEDWGSALDQRSATTTDAALSDTAQSATAAVSPSVVNIDTVLDYGSAEAAGTGIVLSADGLVLTNHHVVEGATTVTGTVVGNGETYSATVLGYDPDTDIAVIRLTDATGLTPAAIDDDGVELGQLVVGVGNAGGTGGDPTAVEGVVTELGATITATDQTGGNAETLDNLIGTDANIQSGQSGGPMIDAEGEVVGVDVAASSGYAATQTTGYAIPIDDALAVAQRIIAGDESGTIQVGATPFLGVELTTSATASDGSSGYGYGRRGSGFPGDWDSSGTPGSGWDSDSGTGSGSGSGTDTLTTPTTDTAGVTIAGVVEGGAAQAAGLAAGDTITALDGQSVSTADELSSLIAAREVGQRLTIAWTDSSGADHTATVTLGAGPVGG